MADPGEVQKLRYLGTRDWWSEAAEYHGRSGRSEWPAEIRVAIRCKKCSGYRRREPFAYAVKSVPPSVRDKTDGYIHVDTSLVAWWVAEVSRVASHRYSSEVLDAVRSGELELDGAPFERSRGRQLAKYWTRLGDCPPFSCSHHRKTYRPRVRVGSLIAMAELALRGGETEIYV